MQATETAGGNVADVVGIQPPGEESKQEWRREQSPGKHGPCKKTLCMLINMDKTGRGPHGPRMSGAFCSLAKLSFSLKRRAIAS